MNSEDKTDLQRSDSLSSHDDVTSEAEVVSNGSLRNTTPVATDGGESDSICTKESRRLVSDLIGGFEQANTSASSAGSDSLTRSASRSYYSIKSDNRGGKVGDDREKTLVDIKGIGTVDNIKFTVKDEVVSNISLRNIIAIGGGESDSICTKESRRIVSDVIGGMEHANTSASSTVSDTYTQSLDNVSDNMGIYEGDNIENTVRAKVRAIGSLRNKILVATSGGESDSICTKESRRIVSDVIGGMEYANTSASSTVSDTYTQSLDNVSDNMGIYTGDNIENTVRAEVRAIGSLRNKTLVVTSGGESDSICTKESRRIVSDVIGGMEHANTSASSTVSDTYTELERNLVSSSMDTYTISMDNVSDNMGIYTGDNIDNTVRAEVRAIGSLRNKILVVTSGGESDSICTKESRRIVSDVIGGMEHATTSASTAVSDTYTEVERNLLSSSMDTYTQSLDNVSDNMGIYTGDNIDNTVRAKVRAIGSLRNKILVATSGGESDSICTKESRRIVSDVIGGMEHANTSASSTVSDTYTKSMDNVSDNMGIYTSDDIDNTIRAEVRAIGSLRNKILVVTSCGESDSICTKESRRIVSDVIGGMEHATTSASSAVSDTYTEVERNLLSSSMDTYTQSLDNVSDNMGIYEGDNIDNTVRAEVRAIGSLRNKILVVTSGGESDSICTKESRRIVSDVIGGMEYANTSASSTVSDTYTQSLDNVSDNMGIYTGDNIDNTGRAEVRAIGSLRNKILVVTSGGESDSICTKESRRIVSDVIGGMEHANTSASSAVSDTYTELERNLVSSSMDTYTQSMDNVSDNMGIYTGDNIDNTVRAEVRAIGSLRNKILVVTSGGESDSICTKESRRIVSDVIGGVEQENTSASSAESQSASHREYSTISGSREHKVGDITGIRTDDNEYDDRNDSSEVYEESSSISSKSDSRLDLLEPRSEKSDDSEYTKIARKLSTSIVRRCVFNPTSDSSYDDSSSANTSVIESLSSIPFSSGTKSPASGIPYNSPTPSLGSELKATRTDVTGNAKFHRRLASDVVSSSSDDKPMSRVMHKSPARSRRLDYKYARPEPEVRIHLASESMSSNSEEEPVSLCTGEARRLSRAVLESCLLRDDNDQSDSSRLQSKFSSNLASESISSGSEAEEEEQVSPCTGEARRISRAVLESCLLDDSSEQSDSARFVDLIKSDSDESVKVKGHASAESSSEHVSVAADETSILIDRFKEIDKEAEVRSDEDVSYGDDIIDKLTSIFTKELESDDLDDVRYVRTPTRVSASEVSTSISSVFSQDSSVICTDEHRDSRASVCLDAVSMISKEYDISSVHSGYDVTNYDSSVASSHTTPVKSYRDDRDSSSARIIDKTEVVSTESITKLVREQARKGSRDTLTPDLSFTQDSMSGESVKRTEDAPSTVSTSTIATDTRQSDDTGSRSAQAKLDDDVRPPEVGSTLAVPDNATAAESDSSYLDYSIEPDNLHLIDSPESNDDTCYRTLSEELALSERALSDATTSQALMSGKITPDFNKSSDYVSESASYGGSSSSRSRDEVSSRHALSYTMLSEDAVASVDYTSSRAYDMPTTSTPVLELSMASDGSVDVDAFILSNTQYLGSYIDYL